MYKTTDDSDFKEVPVDGEVYLGSRVYMVNCASCHALETVTNTVDNGPSLGMIFNRKVATDLNFYNYSNAAIAKSFYWSTKNLFNFIPSNPILRCSLRKKRLQDRTFLIGLRTPLRRQLVEKRKKKKKKKK